MTWNIISHILLGIGLSFLYTRRWWYCQQWIVIVIFSLLIVELTQFEVFRIWNWDYLIDIGSGLIGIGFYWVMRKLGIL